MTYKKILSATLAMAMVASTATVSLAADPEYMLDTSGVVYFEDSNGRLQPSTDYEIKPGESIYVQLKHDGGMNASFAKKLHGYADWTHGAKLVEGTTFDIVSRKANIAGESYTVEATVSGLPTALNAFNKKYTLTGLTLSEAYNTATIKSKVLAIINANTNAIDNAKATLKNEKFEQVSGYSFGGKAYTAAEENALLTAAGYKKAEGGWTYGGATYTTKEEVVTAIAANSAAGKYYYNNVFLADQDAAIKELGYTKVTDISAKPMFVNKGYKYIASPTAAAANSYRNITNKTYYVDATAVDSADNSIAVVAPGTTIYLKESADGSEYVTESTNSDFTFGQTVGYTLAKEGKNYWYSTLAAAITASGSYNLLDATAFVAGTEAYLASEVTAVAVGHYVKDNTIYAESTVKRDAEPYKLTSGYEKSGIYYADDNALVAAFATAATVGYQPTAGGTVVANLTNINGVSAISNEWRSKTDKTIKTDDQMKSEVNTTVTNALANPTITVNSRNAVESKALSPNYAYFVEIPTKPDSSAKTFDLVGSVMVGKTKTDAKKRDILDLYVTLTNGAYEGGEAVEGDVYIDSPDSAAVVKFVQDAGEVYINWGEDAAMVVNVSGQSDLNLQYSVKFDSEFGDKHGYTNMDFLDFPGKPKFNRTGTFYIYADDDKYIYKKTDGGPQEIPGLKYNKSEEAWEIRTNQLTSYVIADDELTYIDEDDNIVAPTPEVPVAPTKPGTKPNPPTGR